MKPSEFDTPEDVDISLTEGVKITWRDGHHSEYGILYLREGCPCATCTNTHGDQPKAALLRQYMPKAKQLRAVEAIGNYAVRFFFSDAHSMGIFTWEYLRQICPCEQCQAAYGGVDQRKKR